MVKVKDKCKVCGYEFGSTEEKYVAGITKGHVCEGCIFKQK